MIFILLAVIILLMIPGMRQIVGAMIWIIIILMWWNWPTHNTETPTAPTPTIERSTR